MTSGARGRTIWTWDRAALASFGVAVAWASVSYIDLGDGRTWTVRGRREPGPYFQQVDVQTDASRFALVAVFRAVVPTVLIGTFSGVLLLAAIGQRIQDRS